MGHFFEDVLVDRVLPVATVVTVDQAKCLVDAAAEAGLHAIEITLRTEVALGALRAVAGRTDVSVGAGTVVRKEQAVAVFDVGVSFVVAPGFHPDVSSTCASLDLPYLPGVATASEITAASCAGHSYLKFFPAGVAGGRAALAAFSTVFSDLRFVPSGGIAGSELDAYLRTSGVVAVAGSWMIPGDALARLDGPTLVASMLAARHSAKATSGDPEGRT